MQSMFLLRLSIIKNIFFYSNFPRDTMVGRVWKGVPLRMRGIVWAKLLDIDALKQEQPGTYERMKVSIDPKRNNQEPMRGRRLV